MAKKIIYVFAYIMQGRNTGQKSNLSCQIVTTLKAMLAEVPIISINISDFEKATYCNRSMVLIYTGPGFESAFEIFSYACNR